MGSAVGHRTDLGTDRPRAWASLGTYTLRCRAGQRLPAPLPRTGSALVRQAPEHAELPIDQRQRRLDIDLSCPIPRERDAKVRARLFGTAGRDSIEVRSILPF